MSKVFSNYYTVAVLVMFSIAIPYSLFAAEVTFHMIPNMEEGNKAALLEVRIDPQSKMLNVVEGEIVFSGTASDDMSVQVENGQSVLPLWPTAPQYDKDKKSISFAGGIPGGFDSEGLLFKLHISSRISGDLNVSYINGNAYLNDGKGTKEFVSSKPFNIMSGKNEQEQISKVSFGFNKYKYAIIILLAIALLMTIFKYGLKKNFKQ
jgi:hypothetical protein